MAIFVSTYNPSKQNHEEIGNIDKQLIKKEIESKTKSPSVSNQALNGFSADFPKCEKKNECQLLRLFQEREQHTCNPFCWRPELFQC